MTLRIAPAYRPCHHPADWHRGRRGQLEAGL